MIKNFCDHCSQSFIKSVNNQCLVLRRTTSQFFHYNLSFMLRFVHPVDELHDGLEHLLAVAGYAVRLVL